MRPIKVHLDTDIGGDPDDVCALALLLSLRDVEITGVTSVLENDGRRAGFARYLLDLVGRREVPVAAGARADSPSFREFYGLPAEARYWPEPVKPLPGPGDAALDLLRQSIDAGALILAIGPLTNLSLLELRQPGILSCARIYLMGGSVRPPAPDFPDWDYQMDFNFQADADAAHRVLTACDPARTTIVPLEVCEQTYLRQADVPSLRQAGPLGQVVARQAQAFAEDEHLDERYGQTCDGLPDDLINFHHDPLACAVGLGWDGVTIETVALTPTLDDGWIRLLPDPAGRPFQVVTTVDGARFGAYWLDAVRNGALRGA